MNQTRRTAIQELMNQLADLKEAIAVVQEQEEEYRDNIPENLQESKKYEKAEAACDNLAEVVDLLGDAIDSLESAKE